MTRMLRLRDVQEATGLPVSSVYAMMASGTFPKNVKLSANRVAWVSDEIAAWQQERINAARMAA